MGLLAVQGTLKSNMITDQMLMFNKGSSESKQIEGKTMETVTDFIFLGSKVTAYGDYNHEIKRPLLLGRIVLTNLDSILKS